MPAVTAIVTTAETRAQLNLPGSSGTEDTELAGYIAAASDVVEDLWGKVIGVACDEWHDGGGPIVKTLYRPLFSLTAVTESYGPGLYVLTAQPVDGSTALDAFGYTVDLPDGVITRRVSGTAAAFARGRRNVHVTYTAGVATVPARVRLATLMIVQHLWRTQRGTAGRPVLGGDDTTVVPGFGFAVPNAALQLLGGSGQPVGIA